MLLIHSCQECDCRGIELRAAKYNWIDWNYMLVAVAVEVHDCDAILVHDGASEDAAACHVPATAGEQDSVAQPFASGWNAENGFVDSVVAAIAWQNAVKDAKTGGLTRGKNMFAPVSAINNELDVRPVVSTEDPKLD